MRTSRVRPFVVSVAGVKLARTEVHPSWEIDEIFEFLEPSDRRPRYVRILPGNARKHRDLTSTDGPTSCPCTCLRTTFFAPVTGWVQPWTVMIGDRRWESLCLPSAFGLAADTGMPPIRWIDDIVTDHRQVLLRRRGDALRSRPLRERLMQLPPKEYQIELFSEQGWERTVVVVGVPDLFEVIDDPSFDGHLISGFHDAQGWAPW